ncbi:AAA family ATPase [Streptomyces sp. NA04227]|uniref:AAA family ATPase n=1 Tax=Streptomyces sp. NA04227 TaxID=2742136 RepID=UPI0015905E42|nr:AAA family ATPase [Streptomyces sp. NA04227]QKW07183.1 AAA family ATPase [Streptomyces sp. NA04227]
MASATENSVPSHSVPSHPVPSNSVPSAAERFVVITGGPGAGKSTLIDRLQEAGFARSQEAGRGVIQDQTAVGGRALPWTDPDLFAELMLCWELRSYRDLAAHAARSVSPGSAASAASAGPDSPSPGPVFFDRGIPDIVGYLRLENRPVPAHIDTAAREFRYHRRVFIAPPWPEIYRRDAERRQSLADAERTYASMVTTYTEYGYELVRLPRVSVAERVRFVTEHLSGPLPVVANR